MDEDEERAQYQRALERLKENDHFQVSASPRLGSILRMGIFVPELLLDTRSFVHFCPPWLSFPQPLARFLPSSEMNFVNCELGHNEAIAIAKNLEGNTHLKRLKCGVACRAFCRELCLRETRHR